MYACSSLSRRCMSQLLLLLHQWAFIGVCCAKLLAMFSLCWKAYKPFRRIVINNRCVV
jgi:hypothetical protein